MVYRGKLSQACEPCRDRRIKCQQGRPECAQCVRAARTCYGYRSRDDLMIVDESEKVASKAILRKQNSNDVSRHQSPVSIDLVSTSKTSTKNSPRSCHRNSPPPSLTDSVDGLAFNFFLASYAPDSHFDYLPSACRGPQINDVLLTSIQAVGMMCLSQILHSPDLPSLGTHRYAKAVKMVNAAIQDPCEATQDSTLMSVMLLGLFEAISYQSRGLALLNWTNHINGAMALLHLRGKKQFDTKVRCEMFRHVTSCIQASYAESNQRIPESLLELTTIATAATNRDTEPFARYSRIGQSFVNFRSARQEGLLVDSVDVVEMARNIDDDCVQLMKYLENVWPYTNAYNTSPKIFELEGFSHRYKSCRVAQFWNTLRMTRISLQRAMYLQYKKTASEAGADSLSDFWEDVRQNAFDNVAHLAKDICASIPQFLSSGQDVASSGSFVSTIHSFYAIWPLSVVSEQYCSILTPEPLRELAFTQLEYIARSLRTPYAKEDTEIDETPFPINGWVHMYYLV